MLYKHIKTTQGQYKKQPITPYYYTYQNIITRKTTIVPSLYKDEKETFNEWKPYGILL
jgi:hypothetical protein